MRLSLIRELNLYSNIQHQCLTELGIQCYELKAQFQVAEPKINPKLTQTNIEMENQTWSQVSNDFISDLKILFPNLSVQSTQLQLTSNVVWQLQLNCGVSFNNGLLISEPPSKLSISAKKKLWMHLQSLIQDV